MITRKQWRYLWVVPLAAIFAVLEGKALTNEIPGDTLSEYVWALPVSLRYGVVALCAWLAAHFATKGKV